MKQNNVLELRNPKDFFKLNLNVQLLNVELTVAIATLNINNINRSQCFMLFI